VTPIPACVNIQPRETVIKKPGEPLWNDLHGLHLKGGQQDEVGPTNEKASSRVLSNNLFEGFLFRGRQSLKKGLPILTQSVYWEADSIKGGTSSRARHQGMRGIAAGEYIEAHNLAVLTGLISLRDPAKSARREGGRHSCLLRRF
jgi:hypothetical protein